MIETYSNPRNEDQVDTLTDDTDQKGEQNHGDTVASMSGVAVGDALKSPGKLAEIQEHMGVTEEVAAEVQSALGDKQLHYGIYGVYADLSSANIAMGISGLDSESAKDGSRKPLDKESKQSLMEMSRQISGDFGLPGMFDGKEPDENGVTTVQSDELTDVRGFSSAKMSEQLAATVRGLSLSRNVGMKTGSEHIDLPQTVAWEEGSGPVVATGKMIAERGSMGQGYAIVETVVVYPPDASDETGIVERGEPTSFTVMYRDATPEEQQSAISENNRRPQAA